MDSAGLKSAERDQRNSWRASRRISNVAAADTDNLDIVADALVSDGFAQHQRTPPTPSDGVNNVSHFSTTTADFSEHSSALSSPPPMPPNISHFSVTTAGESDQVPGPSRASADVSRLSRTTPSKRPSSIAKLPTGSDSLRLRHDGPASLGSGSRRTRSTSPSPNGASLPVAVPYTGPSNPSHPYQLYPQNVRESRPISLALPSDRPSSPEQAHSAAAISGGRTNGIAVGFPGSADHYRRRIGPDGEEVADIIGPDGHTEELPPYTRYPDEHYARKIRDNAVPAESVTAAAPSNASSIAPAPIPGAGGIGLATRNPEFEVDSLASPRSRHSSRTFDSETSNHEINIAAATISEKEKPLKKWQIVARRRMCGVVPYWAICLLMVVLLVMIICVGAVVGTVVARHNGNNQHHEPDPQFVPSPTVTITYDAVPVPTPTDMAPLVTGQFSMPYMSNRQSSLCFNDTSLSQAWNCNLLMFSGLYMNVTTSTHHDAQYDLAMGYNKSLTIENNVYAYGEQPPFIEESPMQLVNDSFQLSRGPAWFKMVSFNKTIILPESVLAGSIPSSARLNSIAHRYQANRDQPMPRDGAGSYSSTSSSSTSLTSSIPSPSSTVPPFMRKNVAQVGDKPWVCVWPETYLEVFIYASQNSSFANAPTNWSTTAGNRTDPWGPRDSAISLAASQTAADTDADSAPRTPSPTAMPTSTSAGASRTGTMPSGLSQGSGTMGSRPGMPYPRVVKIEERRVDKSPPPVCSQVVIQANNQPALPVLDAHGHPIVITIVENEPGSISSHAKRHGFDYDEEEEEEDYYKHSRKAHHIDDDDDNGRMLRDVDEVSECGCLWWVT